jgi:metallo-beta-lactamase class B
MSLFNHERKMRIVALIITILACAGIAHAQVPPGGLKISHLTGDFYIFTTYSVYKGNLVGANGMYVVTNEEVVMIDSPWDTTQFQPLLDSIRIKHNKRVGVCIATHFHEDRTGGLRYYTSQGIKTYTTRQTDDLSKTRGMKRAQFLISKDTTFKVGQHLFQTYYPGPGHAPDNIVVWFDREKILYGGCLIKSKQDSTLGNLGDANIEAYPATLRKVAEKFKNRKFVIPGHNDWSDMKSLEHTLHLAEELKKAGR